MHFVAVVGVTAVRPTCRDITKRRREKRKQTNKKSAPIY